MVSKTAKKKLFYKFHRANLFLLDLLAYNHFYCAKPTEFNDPYDCNIKLTETAIAKIVNSKKFLSHDVRDIIERFRLVENVYDYVDGKLAPMPTHLRTNSEIILELANPNSLSQSLFVDLLLEKLNFRVISFTDATKEKDQTNLRMWAQYAEDSKGVRLGFDFSNDKQIHDIIKKVHYRKVIFEVDDLNNISDAFYYKTKDWQEEYEFRIVTDKSVFIKFDKLSLREVTFGLLSSASTDATLIKCIEGLGYKPIYQKMLKTPEGLKPFEMDIDSVLKE